MLYFRKWPIKFKFCWKKFIFYIVFPWTSYFFDEQSKFLDVRFYWNTEKKTMVVTINSHCKSPIVSGTIFYSWDYYNHIVESTIIILYYIFLVFLAIINIFPLREIQNIVKNTIYFFIKVENTIYFLYTEKYIWYFLLYLLFPWEDNNVE